jgi:hypothetical protein
MLKIERALLEAKFPTINVDNLLEVVMATPNIKVAIEILCGLYESPEPIVSSVKPDKKEYHFVSYNKWTEEVNYSYQDAKTKASYFPKGTNEEDVTMENFDTLKCDESKGSEWISIKTGEYSTRHSQMSLVTWIDYHLLKA